MKSDISVQELRQNLSEEIYEKQVLLIYNVKIKIYFQEKKERLS
ncbi:unnamed protein product (macronuclear) [Paramecium tetraurelia]|uniref:Uncharacterized protein n=1 Tax=Paramecium tetraurelia TaxID=5888 RepID=A0D3R4_PARTE|nr:uncharacterized protein GSPATT00039234001 [Paramecium tetraurelia]CAK77681.1 unnamed protein product [Paramecium tetraurelia]